MGKKIILEIDVDYVVQITGDHGGYQGGWCTACGASGWLMETRYGYPTESKQGASNQLHHGPKCPMNEHLTEHGALRE